MPKNHDLDIPTTVPMPLETVLENNFSDINKIPIYWGPDQRETGFQNYNGPNPEAWRHYEPLNIPQVIRFLVSSPISAETDEYSDDGEEDLVHWICGAGDGVVRCDSDDNKTCYRFTPPFEDDEFDLPEGEYPGSCTPPEDEEDDDEEDDP